MINDRGFAIDVPLVEAAHAAVEEARRRADRKVWELTGGAVDKITQAARIMAWLESRGIPCVSSIAEGEMDELHVKADLFDDRLASEVLTLRASASKTFKFAAMLECVCRDGRIRGTLAYHGTISGRWSGRLVQPQNLKRVGSEEDEQTVTDVVSILKQPMAPAGHALAIDVLCGPPLEALSLCARACIIAPPGKKLVGGDFSNIEGRINAWIAGEAWKVQAFREYDMGTGDDLYVVAARKALGKAEITKADRQLWGKVSELALGYQGGVNAFNKMGANYGVRIENALAKRIVLGWRSNNPAIVASWSELQEAAIEATSSKGCIVSCLSGRVAYRHDNGFLWCRLPSGRVIAYPGAIVERKHKIVVIDGEEVEFNNWGVSFWHGTPFRKVDLYGGMQCAHVVSGTARDVLVEAMFRLEAANYPIVLTVHDEALSEVDEDFGSADHYQQIMERRVDWLGDCPITAKAWEDTRYVK
jgi:DNA polymerase